MEIVCKTCKKPFNAHPGEIASAAIDYTFGRKHTFVCDNCKAENILTKAEYEAIKDAKEAAAKPAPVAVAAPKPVAAAVVAKPVAPVAAKPVAKPVAASESPVARDLEKFAQKAQPREGVVLVASLHVRKDHSTTSETMAGLSKGDKVTIISTWTDGKNTWAQLGPDRWAAIEHNGKTMIEVAK
jgi:hypothetical protein